jgi:DNA-binding ferritin-like protein
MFGTPHRMSTYLDSRSDAARPATNINPQSAVQAPRVEIGLAESQRQAVVAIHESLIRNLRQDLAICANQHGDEGTMHSPTRLLQAHEKMAWMPRAHIK